MSRTPDPDPLKIPGYAADEDAPPAAPPPMRTDLRDEAANRGTRAPHEGSGVATGSGAGAGGGGNPEDFDSDAAGGSQSKG